MRKYGWKRSLPDHRDLIYRLDEVDTSKLPTHTDLRSNCPPIIDQGELGCCVECEVANFALDFERKRQGLSFYFPSRLFVYWNVRNSNGTVFQDSGSTVRDGIKSVNKYGACSEDSRMGTKLNVWPYVISKFAKKPIQGCYSAALHDKVLQYQSVPQDLAHFKKCLSDGFPIIVGISVYESFESDEVAKTGIVPIPSKTEQLLGGHCVSVIGSDDQKQWFIMRNSWGENWGDKGYFYLPYQYLMNSNLASDFWTIRLVG